VARWSHLAPAGGTVLDVACGSGRHLAWFHRRNHRVTGVDRSPDAIESVAPLATRGVEVLQADLEAGPWPFPDRRFDTVVVTNYLWRPLLPAIVAAVAPGGKLIYETFAEGQAALGRPSRPEFLLRPDELLQACAGLRVVAYEDGFLADPPRCVQRIVAVAPDGRRAAPAGSTPPSGSAGTAPPAAAPALFPPSAAAPAPPDGD
jgi:SAM-dependent methyltransferase